MTSSNRTLSAPFQVGWDIVHECNLRCKHCYLTAKELSDSRHLSLDEGLAFIRDLADSGVFHLSIAGGEPLLHPNIVEFIAAATKGGMLVALSTNAMLLSEDLAFRLKDAGLGAIQISLDGSTPETNDRIRSKGVFWKTSNGISNANRAGIPVTIACVILKDNANDIKEIVQMAIDQGAHAVKVQTLIDRGLGEINSDNLKVPHDNLVECIEELWAWKSRENPKIELMLPLVPSVLDLAREAPESYYRGTGCLGCQPGLSTVRVDNIGNVRACGAANSDSDVVGNIRRDTIKNIWRTSAEIAKWRNASAIRNGESVSACGSICGKGCRSGTAPAFARTVN